VNNDTLDARRYRKLRRWMSSNVPEGLTQVEQLAAIACYIDWDAFDEVLDELPECEYGLCAGCSSNSIIREDSEIGKAMP